MLLQSKLLLFLRYLGDLLPELRSTHNALLTNRRCWLALDQILKEQGLPTGGLDYLRDGCLEDKVLQKAQQQQDGEDDEANKQLADNNHSPSHNSSR